MTNTNATATAYDWAIVENDGISDRFATRDEAVAELSDYGPGATVEWAPESDFPGLA